MRRKSEPSKLSLPQQKYVETIHELESKNGHAHCVEIARLLSVRKPSVTEAVNRLIKLNIAQKNGQEVLLSSEGRAIAKELAYRHDTLRRFMIDVLDIEAGRADEMACKIEHSAEPEFISRLLCLAEFIQQDDMAGCKEKWTVFLNDENELNKGGDK